MISKLEKEVILKYLQTRKKDGFLNIISIFSFIGISLGVAVLIIVMSVMNGFRTELVDKILGFNAHAIIQPVEKISKSNKKELNQLIEKFVLSNDGQGVLIHKDNTTGLLVRGYKENDFQKLDFVKNKNFRGNKKISLKHISIGKELSISLNLKIGDKILIMSPSGIETLVGNFPKQQTFVINSIFDSDLNDFDKNVVFINIRDLESLFNLETNDRYIEVYLKNPSQIEIAKKKLKKIFKNSSVTTWSDFNSSLFMALKVERNVMFIILSLIIIVAAFNIISGLTIFVKNKTREIAILKSIGVLNKSITKIFFMIGFIIGTMATMFGILLGVTFSIYVENLRQFLSNIFDITLFPEEIYFLSKMPSELNLYSIILVAICSIIITSIVSIYPALKASKLDIIQSLKYE